MLFLFIYHLIENLMLIENIYTYLKVSIAGRLNLNIGLSYSYRYHFNSILFDIFNIYSKMLIITRFILTDIKNELRKKIR